VELVPVVSTRRRGAREDSRRPAALSYGRLWDAPQTPVRRQRRAEGPFAATISLKGPWGFWDGMAGVFVSAFVLYLAVS